MDHLLDIGLAWVDRQSPRIRGLVIVLAYLLVCCLQIVVFTPLVFIGQDLFAPIAGGIALGAIGISFLAGQVHERRSGRRLDWFGYILTSSFLVPFALAGFLLAGMIEKYVASVYALPIFGLTAILWLAVVVAFLRLGLLMMSDTARDGQGTRVALGIAGGMVIVAILARLLTPAALNFDEGGTAFFITGPIFGAFALLTRLALRRDPAVRTLWPLWAVVGLIFDRWATGEGWSFALAALTERSPSQRADLAALAAFGIAIAALIALIAIWVALRALLRQPRRRLRLRAARRLFLRQEFVGVALVQHLTRRSEMLGRDVIALVVLVGFLSWAATRGDLFAEFNSSELLTFLLYFALCLAVLMLLVSGGMRLFARRRLRFIASLFAPAAAMLPWLAILLLAVELGLKRAIPDDGGQFAFMVVLVPISLGLVLKALSRWRPDRAALRRVMWCFLGYLIADIVVTTLTGRLALKQSSLNLTLGDTAAILTGLFLLVVYLRNFDRRGAFLIWPAGALVAGLTLRAFLYVEGKIDAFAKTVDVSTGFGELLLAAISGAFAGYALLVLKRIYYDRDPQARAEGVRIRGGMLILHAITPVLVLLFILSALHSFLGRASVDANDISNQATRIGASVLAIGDQVQETVGKLTTEADNVRNQAILAASQAANLGQQLQTELDAATKEAVQGLQNTGAAVLADATQQGKKIASTVGDHLSDAISLPPIDVGLFTIDWPDLGIGDAIKKALGGLFSSLLPELDIKSIFEGIVTRGVATLEAQFAAPLARAEAMQSKLESFAKTHGRAVQRSMQTAITEATDATAEVKAQLEIAKTQFTLMVISVTSLLYSLFVFATALILAGLIMALWRAINGLVVMWSRIKEGWAMLIHETEGARAELDARLDALREGAEGLAEQAREALDPKGEARSGPAPSPG